MTPRSGLRFGASVVGLGLAVAQFGSSAQAQITLDGTLGAPGALTGSSITIGAASGQQFGGNLFHSFSQFNVNTGQAVTFAGPASVGNIVSRVTGGSVSNIDGVLGSSIANANLYLINPSGVMFGANASLDVKGSFYATTADYLTLGATGIFRATNPAASTLSSAPPSAFGFLGSSPASIRVRDSFLEVPTGQALSLVGGNISLTRSVLLATGGRMNLASAAGPGEISFLPEGIAVSPGQALGQIEVSRSLMQTDSGGSGLASGAVYIRGGNITLSPQTVINASNNSGSPGGGISLAADGEVRITGAFLVGGSDGAGKGGGISITAARATVGDGAFLFTDAASSGNAGDITLAAGRLEIAGPSLLSAGTQASSSGAAGLVTLKASEAIVLHGAGAGVITISEGSGRAGDVRINAPLVTVEDGAAILSAAVSSGAGGTIRIEADRVQLYGGVLGSPAVSSSGTSGNVIIRASESVVLQDTQGQTAIIGVFTTGSGAAGAIAISAPLVRMNGGYLSSGTTAGGSGGTIDLDAKRIEILNGGLVESNASGLGAGGAIRLRATESILVLGADAAGTASAITSVTEGPGQAGNISVSGPLLTLNGGLLASPTFSSGNAGAIALEVGRLEILGGGRINSAADTGSTGGGGLVDVRASDSILIQGKGANGRPSRIVTDTVGTGAAGNIFLSTASLVLDGGLISSSAIPGSTGAAGTIRITAGSVQVAAGGEISVKSQGTGIAGSIVIDAGRRLELTGGSAITTEAVSADGGDIHITARELVLLRDSSITTSVGTGAGDGGNITIDPTFVVLNNGRIIANAFGGNGGNISIVSEFFITDSGSLVQASSQLGVSGSVVIAAPQSNVGSSVTVLPSAYFDASALMRESCAARAGRANSFVQAGRGGLGAQPGDLAFGDYGWRGSAPAGPKAEARPPRSVVLALGGCAEI